MYSVDVWCVHGYMVCMWMCGVYLDVACGCVRVWCVCGCMVWMYGLYMDLWCECGCVVYRWVGMWMCEGMMCMRKYGVDVWCVFWGYGVYVHV